MGLSQPGSIRIRPHCAESHLAQLGRKWRELCDRLTVADDGYDSALFHGADQLRKTVFCFSYADVHRFLSIAIFYGHRHSGTPVRRYFSPSPHRRIVRSVTPRMSAGSDQVIFFAMAFNSTSCICHHPLDFCYNPFPRRSEVE
jgi:hypothetical protein